MEGKSPEQPNPDPEQALTPERLNGRFYLLDFTNELRKPSRILQELEQVTSEEQRDKFWDMLDSSRKVNTVEERYSQQKDYLEVILKAPEEMAKVNEFVNRYSEAIASRDITTAWKQLKECYEYLKSL